MPLGKTAESNLVPGERRVIRVRFCWAVLTRYIVETVLGVAILYMLARISSPDFWLWQSLLWYSAVGLVIRLAYYMLEWWHRVVIFTNKRVFMSSGLIGTAVVQMPLNKITDLSARQSPIERLLGAGNMRFESAGQVQDLEHLRWLPDFDRLTAAVNELLYGEKTELAPEGSPRRRSRRAGWRRTKPQIVEPADD